MLYHRLLAGALLFQNFWEAKWNVSLNIHLANAIRRALNLKIITKSDLFLTDAVIMDKLTKSQDYIYTIIFTTKRPIERIPGKTYKTEFFKPKSRGIDPFVFEDNKLSRLLESNSIFKNYYDSVKKRSEKGFYIDILLDR